MFNKAKRNNLKVLHTKEKNVDMLKTKQSIKQKKIWKMYVEKEHVRLFPSF